MLNMYAGYRKAFKIFPFVIKGSNNFLSFLDIKWRLGVRKSSTTGRLIFRGTPFQITLEAAGKLLVENVGIFEKEGQVSNAVIDKPMNKLVQRFIPFHSAIIKGLYSSYQGEYGIDRTVYYSTGKTVSCYTVTDWYNTKGELNKKDYGLGYSGLQIYAGFEYPRCYMESVMQFKPNQIIKQLEDNELCIGSRKIIVEPHVMNMAYALEKIIQSLFTEEKQRVLNHILRRHNADRASINQITVHYDLAEINLLSYYLPAFIYSYEVEKRQFYKIINGYNGEIKGDTIYSPTKVFLATSLLGAVIAPFLGPASLPLVITSRVIIGGVTTGISGALFARFQHIYKKYKINNLKIEEIEYNKKFAETNDDIERRETAYRFNMRLEQNTIYPESSKYILLGLDPTKKYTLSDIKKAYHQEISKWQPDTYKGNKTMAINMSIKINEAYKILSDQSINAN